MLTAQAPPRRAVCVGEICWRIARPLCIESMGTSLRRPRRGMNGMSPDCRHVQPVPDKMRHAEAADARDVVLVAAGRSRTCHVASRSRGSRRTCRRAATAPSERGCRRWLGADERVHFTCRIASGLGRIRWRGSGDEQQGHERKGQHPNHAGHGIASMEGRANEMIG